MKKILDTTIATYLSGQENKALQTFFEDTRKCVGKEEKLTSAVRSLFKRFAAAKSYAEKKCNALLSAICYDMIDAGKGNNAGLKCLQVANHPTPEKGVGICESIYFSTGGQPRTLPSGTELITAGEELIAYFNSGAYIAMLGSVDNIYCYKDKDGALVLLNVNDTDKCILCDEESFAGEDPLYFTESTHFISPVFELGFAYALMRLLLDAAQYPHLRIKLKVLYTGCEAHLINEEDMWEESWRDLDLENVMGHSTTLEAQGKEAFTASLLNIIGVANSLYDDIKEKRMGHDQIKRYIKRKLKL